MSVHTEIQGLVEQYFQGVYHGNTGLLSQLFDPAAQVFGVIGGQPYHKTATDYISGVGQRQSPAELGEPYRMKLLALDLLGEIASVRLYSPMLGFDYQLYLTFALRPEGWKIVSKTFTHPRTH